MPITKRQAIDWIRNLDRKEFRTQEELKTRYQLEELIRHYDGIASISESIQPEKEAKGGNVEWYTPKVYVEKTRDVLGVIDLDPASNSLSQSWIKAKKYYTKDDDGLTKDWKGQVFCNPPYGRLQREFVSKTIQHFHDGDIEAILLLNRSGGKWYLDALEQAVAVCQVYARIAFLDKDGVRQKSPRYHNDFVYFGRDVGRFKAIFGSIGKVLCG